MHSFTGYYMLHSIIYMPVEYIQGYKYFEFECIIFHFFFHFFFIKKLLSSISITGVVRSFNVQQ